MSEPIQTTTYQAACFVQEYKKPACPTSFPSKECFSGRSFQKKNITTETNIIVETTFQGTPPEKMIADALSEMCRSRIEGGAAVKSIWAGTFKEVIRKTQ